MKAKVTDLTQEKLRALLDYDADTGVFRWRVRPSSRVAAGSIAGNTSHQRGYRVIVINRNRYLAHRLAWLYVTGAMPVDEIDHIDGDTDSNSFRNLRECSRTQNAQNTRRDVGLTSQYPGVTWDAVRGKWAAKIRAGGGKRIFLGRFGDESDAYTAYVAAKDRLHPFSTERAVAVGSYGWLEI